MSDSITINRAPVLTLWATVVAERLGFTHEEALTLGRAVAGLNAYSKGRALGIIKPSAEELKARRKARTGQELRVELLHRAVPAVKTADGLRALSRNAAIAPAGVEKYLRSKFGEALGPVSEAMTRLADSKDPEDLAASAYSMYEEFRPEIPAGEAGWGAAGVLSLAKIRKMAG